MSEPRWNEVTRRVPRLRRVLDGLSDYERKLLWLAAHHQEGKPAVAPPETKRESRP